MNTHWSTRFLAALAGIAVASAGLISAPTPVSHALDNDLAATPPMGWNSWNQVRCYGLTEKVIRDTIDAIADRGLADKGYEYVVIDDCWQGGRDPVTHKLYTSTADGRFTHGIKEIADYAHSRGLKLGLYAVPGEETCANYWDKYPIKGLGSYGYEALDAATFAEWGVDYLKYDWCRADETNQLKQQEAFAKMRDELNKLDRPIVYGISEYGVTKPWTWAAPVANLWRTTHDIQSTWGSVNGIIQSQANLSQYSGPHAWNDPDMLQIGNGDFGKKNNPHRLAQNRSHFAMWSMLAAPLFLGTNVGALPEDVLSIVSNEEVIRVDQDARGQQAKRVINKNGQQVWVRPLDNGDWAIALFNTTGSSSSFNVTLSDLGITGQGSFIMRDLWKKQDVANVHDSISAEVGAYDTTMIRLRAGADQSLPGGAVSVSGTVTVGQGESAVLKASLTNYSETAINNLSLAVESATGVEVTGSPFTIPTVAPATTVSVDIPITVAPDATRGKQSLPAVLKWGDHSKSSSLTVQVSTPTPYGEVDLSTLPPLSAVSGWGKVHVNKSVDGNPLLINGVSYATGYGTNTESNIVFRLGGNCSRLTGRLGVNDDTNNGDPRWGRPSIDGRITGDDKSLWTSDGVIRYQQSQTFDIDVTGVDTLSLHAGVGGDTNAYDHADWVDLKVVCAEKQTDPTVEQPTDPTVEPTSESTPEEAHPATTWVLRNAKAATPKTQKFKDVPLDSMFAGEIDWLAQKKISTGWADGTFRPLTLITRAAMAAFLYRLAGSPQVDAKTVPFTDVSSSHWFRDEIQWMKDSGISIGWDDGTYRPDEPVSRYAMAAFLHRFCTTMPEHCSSAFTNDKMNNQQPIKFSDALSNPREQSHIDWLSRTGITTGWEDGTFRPLAPINRDAMAAFVYRLHSNEWVKTDK